ncbi:MAG: shikimate dehydrogenase [Actinobacteria bacterium]|nr:shikimate dehydrogenase [Actinomycetota bacterium]NCU78441.1 shikimate dehydrogenase [Actinomycetota bacterium]NCZ76663.1 shikimate dehydrogenase [Actinomycetota bacterium]
MSETFLSELTGSFSTPSAGNPTVAMVEAAYKHHKLNFRYINCEVLPKDLSNAILGARAMNWAGFNLSIPHKVSVIQHLDGLGESAEIMGAVNCVVNRDGKLIGENTDGKGFLQAFKKVDAVSGKKIAILGAGGAARAIAVELALDGAKDFTIINRDATRGEELAKLLVNKLGVSAHYVPWSPGFKIQNFINVVINATSVGMADSGNYDLDIDLDSLSKNMIVADVIVNPPQTNLLKSAAKLGARTIDGLGMVVNQAVIGVKYWTNFEVDPAIMHAELKRVLKL